MAWHSMLAFTHRPPTPTIFALALVTLILQPIEIVLVLRFTQPKTDGALWNVAKTTFIRFTIVGIPTEQHGERARKEPNGDTIEVLVIPLKVGSIFQACQKLCIDFAQALELIKRVSERNDFAHAGLSEMLKEENVRDLRPLLLNEAVAAE